MATNEAIADAVLKDIEIQLKYGPHRIELTAEEITEDTPYFTLPFGVDLSNMPPVISGPKFYFMNDQDGRLDLVHEDHYDKRIAEGWMPIPRGDLSDILPKNDALPNGEILT